MYKTVYNYITIYTCTLEQKIFHAKKIFFRPTDPKFVRENHRKPEIFWVWPNAPSLLGRNWLNHLNFSWQKLFAVRMARLGSLHTLMQRHEQLFKEGLGTVKPYKVSLQVQQKAKPRFFKPRPVPFAIRDAVGKELDRLEQQGILQRVSNSD